MTDDLNTQVAEVAPQQDGTQSEQAVTADEVTNAPGTATDTAEREVVDAKRYKDLQAEFTRTRQELAEIRRVQQAPEVRNQGYGQEPVEIDPESEMVVKTILAREKLAIKDEINREAFLEKHGEELRNDPLLASRVQAIIAEANAKGQYMKQDKAYDQAKKELEARFGSKVQEAKKESFEEGQRIAQQKQQFGAVGDTNTAVQKTDDSQLSSAELARKYNLPRV